MKLFDEKTTKRHSRLVSLGVILFCIVVFNINVTQVPVLGIGLPKPQTVVYLLGFLVVVWFAIWAQLYYLDAGLKYHKQFFDDEMNFFKLHYVEIGRFQDRLENDESFKEFYKKVYEHDGFPILKLDELVIDKKYTKIIKQEYLDYLEKEFGLSNADYAPQKKVFKLTKFIHFYSAFLSLGLALWSVSVVLGWWEVIFVYAPKISNTLN